MNKGDHAGLPATFTELMKLLKQKMFYKLERTTNHLETAVGGLGKNKLDNQAISGWAQQIRYFTFDDGSVLVKAGYTQLNRGNIVLNDHVTITEDMILTGCPSGGASGTYKLQIVRNDDSNVYADDTGNGASVPVSAFGNGTCKIQICLYKNVTFSEDLTFYPMLRPASVVDSSYEPFYKKMVASDIGAIPTTDKGVANGIASLGSDGKVPSSQLPPLGTAASKDTPASGNASATQVVMGNDTRLTDARPASDVSSWAKESTKPSYAYSEISGTPTLGTASAKDVPASGNATITQVVLGNDSRLSDSRNAADVYSWAKASTKPSYNASEVGALAASDIPTTTVAFTEASTRANIATGESIATLFGKIKKFFSDLGSAAFKNVPSSGNAGSSEVVLGSDTRLSDARTANGGNADYATQAGKVGHYLYHKVVREYAGYASGVKFYTIDSFNGYSETESITSFRFRVQVKTTDWSSTTDASGYYYWSFNIMPDTQLFEHMRPNCKLVGSDDDTLPTSAEITAYNLVNYANGVSGGIYTEFTLFAKTKPTTNFYVEFSGICA